MKHTGSADFIDRGGMPLVDQAMHIAVGLFPAALAIGVGVMRTFSLVFGVIVPAVLLALFVADLITGHIH